jgi:signal peptidase I
LVKRVIGLPGDTITFQNGQVHVNDSFIEESYTKGQIRISDNTFSVIVPERTIYVLGDNRKGSLDSRHIGPISLSSIEGRVFMRVWPIDKIEIFEK